MNEAEIDALAAFDHRPHHPPAVPPRRPPRRRHLRERQGRRAHRRRTASSTSTALSSLWNVAVGHGRRELAEAAAEQMSRAGVLERYTGYANVPSIRLTEKLLSLALRRTCRASSTRTAAPRPTTSRSRRRATSGSSPGSREKIKIISRQEAYHGGTMAATAITGMAPFHKGFGPEPPDFVQVPTCYPYRCQWCASKPSCTLECADNIEADDRARGRRTPSRR